MAISKVLAFVVENIIPGATKSIGVLVGCLQGASPQFVLEAFVPLCDSHIRTELAHGASSIPSSPPSSFEKNSTFPFGMGALSDATLHWYQCILYNVVGNIDGKLLLPYHDMLFGVLQASISGCASYRGYKWAGRLLRECVKSYAGVYLLEFAAFDPDHFNGLVRLTEKTVIWSGV